MNRAQKIRELLCPRQKWVNQKDISRCQGCEKTFLPLFVWRHHCRFCGRVFCSDCDANIMSGQSIGYTTQKKLRHCNPCKLRIEMVVNGSQHRHRDSQMTKFKQRASKIEIEDPELTHPQRITQEKIRSFIKEEKIVLENLSTQLLRILTCNLCDEYGLESRTWETKLSDIAWQAALETKPEIFIRRTPFNLQEQIKVVTIITPPESVTAACVKGLVLEKNLPSKSLDMHLKYPRMVTIKPAISAESLTQSKSLKFDELVNNVDNILRTCLGQVFKLNPSIMFVQEEVNQVANQLALERKIMVISKVKPQDLQKIERLAGIKKRIQNFFNIDRQQVAEIIGCCDRVYFKTVRQGSMLMFIENQSGIRTVLLGDSSESSNIVLKKIFDILLRAAWNLKNQREVIIRDAKLCSDQNSQAYHLAVRKINPKKYQNLSTFLVSQQHIECKIRYSFKKAENLSKSFQDYLKQKKRKGLYDACGDDSSRNFKFYSGEELSLGTFLLKFALQNMIGCQNCGNQHIYRYFNDEFCITISNELQIQNSKLFLSQTLEEDAEYKKIIQEQEYMESYKIFQVILKFMNLQGLQFTKIQFVMYFRCEDCGKDIGNVKQNVGNDFLLMNLNHFLCIITNAAFEGIKNRQNFSRNQSSDKSQSSQKNSEEKNCLHSNISRVFQFLRSKVSFTINRIDKYHIVPITFNQNEVKKVLSKDEAMVAEIFKKLHYEKVSNVEYIQTDMARLPFSGDIKGSVVSFSIAGTVAEEHPFFEPFVKIERELKDVKQTLKQMQVNMDKAIQEGRKDWTVTLRKYAKIDHAIKIIAEMISYIMNAMKKQKIEETINTIPAISEVDQAEQMVLPVADDHTVYSKKNTDLISQSESDTIYSGKLSLTKTNSFMTTNFVKLKKENSALLDPEFDNFMKSLKKKRYLKFQGSYLYYPIASIDDAVSLLSCFLNSEQFKESLKETVYRNKINMKLPFTREMKNDYPPYISLKLIYKFLTKQDYNVEQVQDIQFFVYHHKCFQEIRKSQGINFRLYVRSLYSCQSWDSSGGKSNSTFSKANNQTLVVKIINQKEFVQFQKFAFAYLQYMKNKRKNGSESFLAKIYGIYEVYNKRQVYKCVVMQNIFFGLDEVHKVYDLKGSQVNRLAPKGTGLDTNFIIDKNGNPYLLEPEVYDRTMANLTEDANFLKEQGVIDYSLLVIESGLGLRMAIIDFMRPYHFVEKIENIYKNVKSGKDPTVIPPPHYAERFIKAMHRYFAKAGSCCEH